MLAIKHIKNWKKYGKSWVNLNWWRPSKSKQINTPRKSQPLLFNFACKILSYHWPKVNLVYPAHWATGWTAQLEEPPLLSRCTAHQRGSAWTQYSMVRAIFFLTCLHQKPWNTSVSETFSKMTHYHWFYSALYHVFFFRK